MTYELITVVTSIVSAAVGVFALIIAWIALVIQVNRKSPRPGPPSDRDPRMMEL